MLYRYSEVFRTLLGVADALLVATAWLAAYALRFGFFDAPKGIPPFEAYLPPLLLIVPLWIWLFRSHGLYEPQRTEYMLQEAGKVVRASAVGVVLLVAATFFVRSYFYSRGVMLVFSLLAPTLVIGFRMLGRVGLHAARRRGYNLRYVLVVGAGQLAAETIERIHAHPEAGLRVLGVFAELGRGAGTWVAGIPVLGGIAELKQALHEEHRVDQVIIALPQAEGAAVEKVLADLEDEVVSVKLVPDLLHVLTLRHSVENLDGLPVINLRDSPLVGWPAVQKRVFDVAVSALGLVLLAPVMAGLGVAVLAASGRPILYSQRRCGLDGRVFRIWKFRSMRRDSEKETGPIFATRDDARVTRTGRLMRRLGLDELPQLWNVLRGDMSLVGPRPERPHFIEEFRREIPGYMLRHKVKAGLTGWAQVHGWRGDTSLHERVEHDIWYIQNWSFGLDLRILLMTLTRFDRNGL